MDRGRGRGWRGNRGRGRGGQMARGAGRPNSAYRGRYSSNMAVSQPLEGGGGGPAAQTRRAIGYQRLKKMVEEDDPEEIVLLLSSTQSGLEELLSGGIRGGMTEMLLKVFAKMSECDEPQWCVQKVLQVILHGNFLSTAILFIYEVFTENRKKQTVLLASCILKLIKSFLTVLPSDSEKEVRVKMKMLQTVVLGLGDEGGGLKVEYDEVNNLLGEIDVKQTKKGEWKRSNRDAEEELHMRDAPNDFRTIPVFPQLKDIKGDEEVYLRTNLTHRAYHSPDHYLDVQFRLLREDFIRPLREGIDEVIQQDVNSKQRLQNVKVYENVKIEFTKPDQKGILHLLHFSTEKFQKIRWHNTKRLLYGNLLCLSSDKFNEDVIFAVVADRKPEDLANGYLFVQFVYEQDEEEVKGIAEEDLLVEELESDNEFPGAHALPPQDLKIQRRQHRPRVDTKKVYTMVETDAYFEAYRHVLVGLQETGNIPLERYIVSCSEDLHAPEYLRPSVAGMVDYDFRPVCKTEQTVTLLLASSWPSPEQLSLNESQTEALKLALTNELAIIQGPPGTGKTHVGLEIMKILLSNKARWFRQVSSTPPKPALKPAHCPILIVCYTNHALDQFLEGIAKFSGKDRTIVRVGGRSKNEVTKQYSLVEIRRKRRQDKEANKKNKAMKHAIWDVNNNLRKIEANLQANINKLEASLRCIQKLSHLQDYIPPRLYDQFCNQDPFQGGVPNWIDHEANSPDEVLLSWLGLAASENPAAEPQEDFTQEAYGIPESTVALLQQNGYSLQQIVKAVHATGDTSPMTLFSWLNTNQQVPGPPRARADFDYFRKKQKSKEVIEDNDDGIDEEAELLQEQRMIEPDENERQGIYANQQDNTQHVMQLMDEMSALTFHEITAKDSETDKDEWETPSQQKRKLKGRIKKLLGKTTIMTNHEEAEVQSINSLSQEDRWRLYRTWVARWRDQFRVGSDRDIDQYNTFAKRLEDLKKQEDAEILRSADVVAVTTTGAAKYRDLIYRLNTKIVVVEEAAEVLEAHIITSMPHDTKHLILIGDHQQLKPSPTVYQLATDYNLDMSLFERLIKVGIPHVTLACQHRMRPEIADLIRPHIYKELGDHESVEGRDEIIGVQKSMFFVSHNVQEESITDGKSKMNQHEADFIVALTKYLLLQGYAPEQITILTMYTGQIFAFKNVMKQKMCRGVRVTAVDNFQGEENDIILLSLVRSNAEGSIGFLKTDNRICVALSRAKIALYCIGNMQLLQRKSQMWRNIAEILHEKECIGEALILKCKNHPDRHIEVKNDKDFRKAPEGGCGQACGARLKCGHSCPRSCHPNDHSTQKCLKRCDNILECGHNCNKSCFQPCQPCTILVTKIMPKCGHTQKVACSADETRIKCNERVEVKLPCDHAARVACWKSNSLTMSMCEERCPNILDCGHTCTGSCYECYQGRLHVPCMEKCHKKLACGHKCESFCSNCPPCVKKCVMRCRHSKCYKNCGEPCIPCQEKCQWKCKHYKCTKKCGEPCDRPPCDKPCTKLLRCRHACIGLCGEPCPKYCRVCRKDVVQDLFFGDESDPLARFVQLEDCGHIFTYQSLDKWMNRKDEGSTIKMKRCPRCNAPILRSTRYGNIVNKLANSMNEAKRKLWGSSVAESNRKHVLGEISTEMTKSQLFTNEMAKIRDALKTVSQPDMLVLVHRFRRLQKLGELKKAITILEKTVDSSEAFSVVDRDWNNIVKWVCINRSHLSTGDKEGFNREITRIYCCLKFIDIEAKCKISPKRPTLLPHVSELHELLLDSTAPYDYAKQKEVQRLFDTVLAVAPELTSDLGKKMDSASTNLQKTSWNMQPEPDWRTTTPSSNRTMPSYNRTMLSYDRSRFPYYQ